jgi:hypothetical protein
MIRDDKAQPTPRTDKAASLIQYAVVGEQYAVVTAEFARQLEREIAQHQQVAAAAYQLAGLVGAPVRFLDALGDAANGEIGKRTDPEKLLPVDLIECDQCTPSATAPKIAVEISDILREALPYTVGYDTDLPKRIEAILAGRAATDRSGA